MKEYIDDINYIQDVFCISMSNIAFLLDKTRTDICTYKEYKEPSETTKLNIKRLVKIAEFFDNSNIERLPFFIYREIKDGKILLELIKENIYTLFLNMDDLLLIIKDISKEEAIKRKEEKSSGKFKKSLEDVLNEYSTPIFIEDNKYD